MSDLERFGISLPKDLLAKFDKVIAKKGYENRSEAIRDLMRDHLVEEAIEEGKEVFGSVTIVFDHHVHDLADKLNHIQHDFFENIISSTHIHLDHHNCLEVLALKGKAERVKTISDKLISTKGVKHGKLVITTTGKEF